MKFCLSVGAILSGLMALVHLTGLDAAYFRHVLTVQDELVAGAAMTVILCAALPFINSAMSALRGFLTAEHATSVRLYAIGGGVGTLVAALFLGVKFQWPGLVCATSALVLSQVVELGILGFSWSRIRARNKPATA